MVALEAGALILGLAAVAMLFLLDRPEDAGKVTPGWMRRHETGRDQR